METKLEKSCWDSNPWPLFPSYGVLFRVNSIDQHFQTRKDVSKLQVVDENDNDSVEGIMFTKDKAVIMTGTFTSTYEPGKLNRMGLWYKPWFYKVMSLSPWSIA